MTVLLSLVQGYNGDTFKQFRHKSPLSYKITDRHLLPFLTKSDL